MATPTGILSSMGAHKLDVRYGDRNTLPYYNGIIDTALIGVADASITAGRVMSVTTGIKLVPGIVAGAATASGGPDPYFLQNGLDINTYPDATRTRGMPGYLDKPAAGTYLGGANGGLPFYGIPLSTGLVGGYATIQWRAAAELSSTEMDTTLAALYVPGAPLTAVSVAGAAGIRGRLRTLNAATDTVVGYVAPAAYFTSAEGYPTLAFRPAFVPGTTVANA